MPAVLTLCPSCGMIADDGNRKLAETLAIAKAISCGASFSVFDLAASVAKARVEIGIDGDPGSPEAVMAAEAVKADFANAVRQFNRHVGNRAPCGVCRTSKVIGFAIYEAVQAVADYHAGTSAPYQERLLHACKELAAYAGDEFPDEDATRTVLDRACDVFLAALASVSPERGPN